MKPVEFDSLIIVPTTGSPRLSACLTRLGLSIETVLSDSEQTLSSVLPAAAWYPIICWSYFGSPGQANQNTINKRRSVPLLLAAPAPDLGVDQIGRPLAAQ